MRIYLVPAVILTLLWVVFVTLHLFFLETFLYWHITWLDIAMHICGGGLVVYTTYLIKEAHVFPRFGVHFLSQPLIVLSVLAIGWEIFRYSIATELLPNYRLDTLIDLITGLGGGLLVYLVLSSRRIKS